MKYYMGMDHGTTSISFQIIDKNKKMIDYFKLNRDKLSNNGISLKEIIQNHINPNKINLLGMTYAMGDGISSITPIELVKNRGIEKINGAGKVTGGGSKVYTDILNLKIPSILIPGLHSNCEFLDDRFRASYSHCASSEKVSLTYYAKSVTNWNNMIIADISSNTVCILVEDGKIKGAIDACIGAMGFIHGPLDLNMIRNIDSHEKTANECFSNAGIAKIAKINAPVTNTKEEIIKKAIEPTPEGDLAIRSLIMSVVMEIYGLYGIMENKIEGIVLTGSGGSMTSPINISKMITEKIKKIAPVHILTDHSGAIGSSFIARDLIETQPDTIMGIPIKKKTYSNHLSMPFLTVESSFIGVIEG